MAYPTGQISPSLLMALLSQQGASPNVTPPGGPAIPNPLQRGSNVSGPGPGLMAPQLPVSQPNALAGLLSNPAQLVALKSLLSGGGSGGGGSGGGASLLGNGFWNTPGGGGLDRLFGLFGNSGVNAPNFLSNMNSGLSTFNGVIE